MLLTVVLVIRRHQAWLRPCLRSILDQAPADLDVVVVDDASPDHGPRILAEAAGGDPRVRTLRFEEVRGLAAARDAGLAMAVAEYVWFVDAADLLRPGALDAVIAALAPRPDVLELSYLYRDLYGAESIPPPVHGAAMFDKVVRREHLPGAGRVERLDTPVYTHRLLPRAVRDQWTDGDPSAPLDDAPGARPRAQGRRAGPVRRAVRALRKVPRSRKTLAATARRQYYAVARRRPLDPDLAVFTAYWGGAYSCNPRAIFEKTRELVPSLRGVWVVKAGSEHVLPAGVEHVVEGSRAYYRLMARATYFVNNANFDNDIVKRPGQVHLQTHHGTPLKTMGLDLVGAPHSSMGLNFRRLMKRVERWDYSISANAFTTEIWERVYPSGTYESLETGYPRNDVLATATAEHKARVRAELGVEPGQKAVLYTPTHREYTKEYVPLLDVDALVEALGPDHVVLMRAHYFYGRAATSGASGRVIDVAGHPSIEELAIASDVLVTDYSSLMFDYAVLDRPIVVYAPDWETYRSERGTYFDLLAEPPGAVATTQEDLTEVLRSGRAEDAASAALRAAFRSRYCSLEDGRAAERVVRRLWPDSAAPAPATGDHDLVTRTVPSAAPVVKEEA